MIINYFLRKPLLYKDIEKYQYKLLFCVASYSVYNIYFVKDFTFLNHILFGHLLTDLLFIPFNKMDTIIHHMLGIGFIYYPTLFSIPLRPIYLHQINFLKVETSSIFLCSSYFLKEYKKQSKHQYIQITSNISNVLLLSTFFKFRCYDFLYKILKNPDFYNDMIIPNNTMSKYYIYTTVGAFCLLNGYWFSKLANVFYKTITK
jgi:hypothetical protein